MELLFCRNLFVIKYHWSADCACRVRSVPAMLLLLRLTKVTVGDLRALLLQLLALGLQVSPSIAAFDRFDRSFDKLHSR